MATYEITKGELKKLYPGDVITCQHTGEYKILTLARGTYKLECFGAQGYPATPSDKGMGGKGGYATGVLTINRDTDIYLYVGGVGRDDGEGGFNGGGDGGYHGGGGATDIRIDGTSLYKRALVAGGGGGRGDYTPPDATDAEDWSGGNGGGPEGTDGLSTKATGQGASQTAGGLGGVGNTTTGYPGEFGKGGDGGKGSIHAGAGGGGGWYGGGGGGYITGQTDNDIFGGSAGGGSGYVFTREASSLYPEGCLLVPEYYLTEGAMGTGVHTGDGLIKITVLDLIRIDTVKLKLGGKILHLEQNYIKVDGVWKECASAYLKENGKWKNVIEKR